MHEEMRNYWIDEDIRYKWDTLQRDFQCCGALNLKTGFQVNYCDQSTNHSDQSTNHVSGLGPSEPGHKSEQEESRCS